jgi:HEPN domain-containing protein
VQSEDNFSRRLDTKSLRAVDMKNTQKARDWLHMSLKEYDDALGDLENQRNSEAIQHAQQCAERVGKSILSYLSFAVKKTHHPSDYILQN